MTRAACLGILLLALLGAGCDRPPPGGEEEPGDPPPMEPSAGPDPRSVGGVAARRTDSRGVVADLLSARRDNEGELEVTVRFRNTTTLPAGVPEGAGDWRRWRLTAGGREWGVAREDDGDPAAPKDTLPPELPPGESRTWRVQFQAPPAGVEAFDLAIPGVVPFEAVPIEPAEPEAVPPTGD